MDDFEAIDTMVLTEMQQQPPSPSPQNRKICSSQDGVAFNNEEKEQSSSSVSRFQRYRT